MKTFWLLVICFTALVLSCISKDSSSSRGDSVKLIKLDLSKAKSDSMNLSEIATRIEYIPLERTDQSLIGHGLLNLGDSWYGTICASGSRLYAFGNNGLERFIL